MTRRTWMLGALGAVLAVGIGASAVMAQSAGDGETAFLDRVAEKLGIDRPKLDQAIQGARSDELDEAVANGNLSQEQAGRLKEQLDNLPADVPLLAPTFGRFRGELDGRRLEFGGPGFKTFSFGLLCPGLGMTELFEKLTGFLGVTKEQLATELRADDATLASVAEAHGKSREDLKAFLESEIRAKLDEAVANEDLTQKRADEILTGIREHLDDIIDRGMHSFGGRLKRGPFPFGERGEPLEDDGTQSEQRELPPALRS